MPGPTARTTGGVPARRAGRLSIRAVLAAFVLVACGGVDKNTTLDKIPRNEAFKKGLGEGFAGVLTDAEINCVGSKVFSRPDISVGDIEAFAKHPVTSGPVFENYKAAFVACVDLTVKLAPKRPEGAVRDGTIAGLRSAAPDLTDAQADCIIEHLFVDGIGVREIVLAGYLPNQQAALVPKAQAAGAACLR